MTAGQKISYLSLGYRLESALDPLKYNLGNNTDGDHVNAIIIALPSDLG